MSTMVDEGLGVVCRVQGCAGLAAIGRSYCLRCEQEIDGLAMMAQDKAASRDEPARLALWLQSAGQACDRLHGFWYGCATVAVMWWLFYETRVFWKALLSLWFGIEFL